MENNLKYFVDILKPNEPLSQETYNEHLNTAATAFSELADEVSLKIKAIQLANNLKTESAKIKDSRQSEDIRKKLDDKAKGLYQRALMPMHENELKQLELEINEYIKALPVKLAQQEDVTETYERPAPAVKKQPAALEQPLQKKEKGKGKEKLPLTTIGTFQQRKISIADRQQLISNIEKIKTTINMLNDKLRQCDTDGNIEMCQAVTFTHHIHILEQLIKLTETEQQFNQLVKVRNHLVNHIGTETETINKVVEIIGKLTRQNQVNSSICQICNLASKITSRSDLNLTSNNDSHLTQEQVLHLADRLKVLEIAAKEYANLSHEKSFHRQPLLGIANTVIHMLRKACQVLNKEQKNALKSALKKDTGSDGNLIIKLANEQAHELETFFNSNNCKINRFTKLSNCIETVKQISVEVREANQTAAAYSM